MNNSLLDIAAGRVPGKSAVNKFGHGPDCDNGVISDIWSRNDITKVWLPPTQARIHQITSTSAQDTSSGGVGAKQITIYGLKTWDSDESTEVISMSGTGTVNTAESYVIIHRMKVTNFGISQVNLGRITATAVTDGSVTAEIPYNSTLSVGAGQTLMAVYGIPSTKVAYMPKYYFSVINNVSTSIDVGLFLATNPEVYPRLFTVKHKLGSQSTGTSSNEHNFKPYFRVAGPAILKIQVVSSANGVSVSAGFDLILEDA